MRKVMPIEEPQDEGKVMPRQEPQNQMSTVLPTEEPQDQAGRVMPKKEPATGKKGLIRILGFKKKKKKEKEDTKSVIPATPMIEEVASPSTVAEEPITRVGPVIKEEPTPDGEATTKADDKVSRFELVVSSYSSWMRDLFTNAVHAQFKLVREVQHESE
jgi:hypothetical protein